MQKLIAILLLLSNASFAQSPTQQIVTQFDKFINKPEIEWAAYINDTIRFENFSLNKLLLTRLAKNEIKASMPVSSGSAEADQIKYSKKKDIDLIKFPGNEIAVFDSTGNLVRTEHRSQEIDTASFTLTDATQILFIENGQLKTYTPWVATMLPVITSTGVYLGNGDYFSTCFNFNYAYQAGKQNKILFLSQSKRKIRPDSFDVRSKLKELYGRNVLQTLWPYILKDKFEMFDCTKNKKLKAKELDGELISGNGSKVAVPIYDSLGNITGSKIFQEALSIDVFTSIELIQDWYYDQTKNIVFNTVRELYLYAKKRTTDGEAKEATPILKIVFK
ncbi:MAG: hypothetical protein ABI666_00955 [Ferruginibacter sp.]